MNIFPAIDLFEGKAVRLLKGDYAQMTVYSEDPPSIGEDFANKGAQNIHIVDLEGARSGSTPNFDTVLAIKERSGLFCEIGGGIRSMDVVDRYLDAGIDRVIIGTAAVTDPDFLVRAILKHGEKIAVGIDIKDGFAAIKGWTEKSTLDAFELCSRMEEAGVRTLICTDISKDGAMSGTNLKLYWDLSRRFRLQIIASGGVSSLNDLRALASMDLHGAIIGRAYYTGAIDIAEAVNLTNCR